MDKVPQLGHLIFDDQHRDAVHIAVAPVIAGETLTPGQRIGFTNDGDAFTVVGNTPTVGIVDPFLHEKAVYKGDRFYMFLLPNTITSLRHDWTHPAFEREAELAAMEPTLNKLRYSAEEAWITEYAREIGSDYDEIMEAAANYQATGDYLVRGGTFEGVYLPDEFWDKYEVVKRTRVTSRGSFFGCSC